MTRWATLLTLLAFTGAQACTYCDPANLKLQTFRQEARTSKFVIIGSLNNPRLVGDSGVTDIIVEQVVKNDPALAKKKTITLPRWTPVDPKKPPRMLLFVDVYEGKIDPFRGVMLRGTGMADYLRSAIDLDDRNRTASLLYYFRHLDSTDPEVAADAFLEFAKASDAEIAAVGPKLDAKKLRAMLSDSKVPAERLGLFAFLLGACGTRSDIEFLNTILDKGDDRSTAALSGVLGGLIERQPEAGWKRAIAILDDPKRQYQDKLAVLGTIRFFQACQPKEHRQAILLAASSVVAIGDMADMAIEDLRRWKWFDLTKQVLAQYGKPTHAAPLVKNAIVRYALSCPDPQAAAFVKSMRTTDAELVREIEESLELERPATPKPKP